MPPIKRNMSALEKARRELAATSAAVRDAKNEAAARAKAQDVAAEQLRSMQSELVASHDRERSLSDALDKSLAREQAIASRAASESADAVKRIIDQAFQASEIERLTKEATQREEDRLSDAELTGLAAYVATAGQETPERVRLHKALVARGILHAPAKWRAVGSMTLPTFMMASDRIPAAGEKP